MRALVLVRIIRPGAAALVGNGVRENDASGNGRLDLRVVLFQQLHVEQIILRLCELMHLGGAALELRVERAVRVSR